MDSTLEPQQTQTEEKKPYAPPRLAEFGDVRRLTQAGTQGKAEDQSSSPQRKA